MLALAVHGGAGVAPPPERADAVRGGVARAASAGWDLLAAGGSALDAVNAAVRVLEDDAAFNAGRGSVLTRDGAVEMDAAVMDGAGRRAGAVGAVTGIRHPVDAARAVLEDGGHVLLCGPAAVDFALGHAVETTTDDWLITTRQRERLATWLSEHGGRPRRRTGTVGAVARDQTGHVAAATSTGGTLGQRAGRLGDTPVIGAGTWADDRTVAVSCTGDGEAIVRGQLAHEIDAGMRHAGLAMGEAARRALAAVADLGGDAGLIAVDAAGTVGAFFTSAAMSRAWRAGDGPLTVGVLPGDEAPVR